MNKSLKQVAEHNAAVAALEVPYESVRRQLVTYVREEMPPQIRGVRSRIYVKHTRPDYILERFRKDPVFEGYPMRVHIWSHGVVVELE